MNQQFKYLKYAPQPKKQSREGIGTILFIEVLFTIAKFGKNLSPQTDDWIKIQYYTYPQRDITQQ